MGSAEKITPNDSQPFSMTFLSIRILSQAVYHFDAIVSRKQQLSRVIIGIPYVWSFDGEKRESLATMDRLPRIG